MRFRIILISLILSYTSLSGAVESMILPGSSRLIRGMIAGADVIALLMAVSAMLRNRSFYGVWLWIAMVFGGLLTFAYNFERLGVVAQLNGIRGLLFFLSCLIVMQDIFESEYRPQFVRLFTRFLVILAMVQLPVALGQFIAFGAGDNVGGTYGIEGGSGILTGLLFLIVFYMIVRFGSLDEGESFSLRHTLVCSLLLAPCAINETKISFFLVGMMVILISFSRRRWYKAIPFLAVGGVLFSVFVYYYGQTVGDPYEIFTKRFIERYLYTAPRSEQMGDVPRLMRVSLMFQFFREDVPSMFLGMGYGLFGGGTLIGTTRLARTLYYLTTGSRILLVTVWLQGGLIALSVMMGATFGYVRTKLELPMTLRRLSLFLAGMLALIWVYNEALLDRTFAGVVAFVMIWIRHGGMQGEERKDEEPAGDDSVEATEGDDE